MAHTRYGLRPKGNKEDILGGAKGHVGMKKDHHVLGSILGPPSYGNLHILYRLPRYVRVQNPDVLLRVCSSACSLRGGLGCRVQGPGFRVVGLGFWALGFGLRVLSP